MSIGRLMLMYLWILMLFCWTARTQELPIKLLRPYMVTGVTLNANSGTNLLSWQGVAGLLLEKPRWQASLEGHYETLRKTDDGTGQNNGFHFGGLGTIHVRYRQTFLGVGTSWGEESTSKYVKKAWHPILGAGHDWQSLRLETRYYLPGSDWLNAVQGPEFVATFPGPRNQSHFFYQQTFHVLFSHATRIATQREHGYDAKFLVGYRF